MTHRRPPDTGSRHLLGPPFVGNLKARPVWERPEPIPRASTFPPRRPRMRVGPRMGCGCPGTRPRVGRSPSTMAQDLIHRQGATGLFSDWPSNLTVLKMKRQRQLGRRSRGRFRRLRRRRDGIRRENRHDRSQSSGRERSDSSGRPVTCGRSRSSNGTFAVHALSTLARGSSGLSLTFHPSCGAKVHR